MAQTDPAPDKPVHTLTKEGLLTDSWYLAARSVELKRGGQMRRLILGEPVMLGRTRQGKAFALRDVCPHRRVPLSAGRQVETAGEATVECPYHGWRFGTDGVCRLLPSLTDDTPYEASRIRVRRYPVHEASGAVFIHVHHDPRETGLPALAPPDISAMPDRPKLSWQRALDVPMDEAVTRLASPERTPLVQAWGLWRAQPGRGGRDRLRLVARERGWAMTASPGPGRRGAIGLFPGKAQLDILFQLPGFRWEILEGSGARLVALTGLTPETPCRTHLTQLVWWAGAPQLNLVRAKLKATARRQVDTAQGRETGRTDAAETMLLETAGMAAGWYERLKSQGSAARLRDAGPGDEGEPVQPPRS